MCTKTIPLRVHRSHSNIKNKTNWRSHEEHQPRNDVGFNHGRDLVAPQLRFLFFLLFFSQFSQYPSMMNLGTSYSASFMPIYGKKRHLVDLQLAQASWDSAMKQLARPGKLVTLHGSLLVAQASQRLAWASYGSGSSMKRPFCPLLLVFFAFLINTLNDHLFRTVTGFQHHKSTSKDQKINER